MDQLSPHPSAIADIFATWSQGRLGGYLIEISAQVCATPDQDGSALVEHIVDEAEQNGTGRWAAEAALELGVPLPSIAAAVFMRNISARRTDRQTGAKLFAKPPASLIDLSIDTLEAALHGTLVATYAQGLELARTAAATHGWPDQMARLVRVWRAGCIIRALFLDDAAAAFDKPAHSTNLLLDPNIGQALVQDHPHWSATVGKAMKLGIAVPAMAGALTYFDVLRSGRLPSNLVQAQRDLFGAHGFHRTDAEGTFHAEWAPPMRTGVSKT
jgi:6-phosphogluconate dehydrogenase